LINHLFKIIFEQVNMSNFIFLENLKVKSNIGVTSKERSKKQPLRFDVQIELKGKKLFKDDINNTIDYAEIEKIITDVATKNQFKLLETLGEVIIETIGKQCSFKSIRIKIAKNKIIKSTEFVGVIIER